MIAESKKHGGRPGYEGRFTAGCAKCANYRCSEWRGDGLIHHVNLSIYPSPRQCRCIYCCVYETNQSAMGPETKEAYEKLFDTLVLARESGLIATDATWQVSCGEITVHPYREQIIDFVRGQRAIFYTNCFKFDEDIAQNLHDNPHSMINLSIDAGTPETWRKIKGFDNFEAVTSNLVKCRLQSARLGQITLKYIVLPGINDTYEDYLSLIEIMKVLDVKHLSLSRDTRYKYQIGDEEQIKLVGAAAYLVAMCYKNGISNDLSTYTPEEIAQVQNYANEILRSGQV